MSALGAAVIEGINLAGSVDFLLSIRERGLAVFIQQVVDNAWIVLVLFAFYWWFKSKKSPEDKGKGAIWQKTGAGWRTVLILCAVSFLSGMLLAEGLFQPLGILAVKGVGAPNGRCRVVVDGTRLALSAKKFNLAVACGIADITIDDMDNPNFKISNPFDIRKDDITIEVAPPEWHGNFQIRVKVLLLPKNVAPEQIKTLRDVEKLGGKILQMH